MCVGDTPILLPRKQGDSLGKFSSPKYPQPASCLSAGTMVSSSRPSRTAHNPIPCGWLWKGKKPENTTLPPQSKKLMTSSSSAAESITRQQSSSRGGRRGGCGGGRALPGPGTPGPGRRAWGTRHIAPGCARRAGGSAPLPGRAAPRAPGSTGPRQGPRRGGGGGGGAAGPAGAGGAGCCPKGSERRRFPGTRGRSAVPLPRSRQRLQCLTSSQFHRAEEGTA